MKPESYRQRWEQLQPKPDVSQLEHLAKQIALSFLDHHYYNDEYRSDYIDLLCEMATASADSALTKPASSALFGIIVESLCDDFEEFNTAAYNQVMSQVIAYYRQTPDGQAMDKELKNFGLYTSKDLFQRIEGIRAGSDECKLNQVQAPEKILILSRVTLGADVAVTSVIVQYLQDLFPRSEVILLGGEKLNDLFGGNAGLSIKTIDYSRRGSLAERLNSWHTVRKAIDEEIADLPLDKAVLVDPDSRLSQLGVFPLVQSAPYLFFNSRGTDDRPKHVNVAELTNYWLNKVFNDSAFYHPNVWLRQKDLEKARSVIDQLRTNGCERIIRINLGVGGNERKRLSRSAEEKLILKLLQAPDTVVVLDKGAGAEEQERIEQLAAQIEAAGETVKQISSAGEQEIPGLRHGLLCISGGIGEMAALISYADEYIGYDSACQHIAAALGIPRCTIFAGSNDPAFVRRWCASGPGQTKVVHVDTLTTPPMFDDDDIVARVIHARSEEYQT